MRPLLAPIRAMRSRLGLTTLTREEHGQDLLEYGLLAALIALVALAAVATVGNTIQTVFWNAIAAASF